MFDPFFIHIVAAYISTHEICYVEMQFNLQKIYPLLTTKVIGCLCLMPLIGLFLHLVGTICFILIYFVLSHMTCFYFLYMTEYCSVASMY
jgi:hypothetical protein